MQKGKLEETETMLAVYVSDVEAALNGFYSMLLWSHSKDAEMSSAKVV